jgi:predicted PurR-regulated permease PerM
LRSKFAVKNTPLPEIYLTANLHIGSGVNDVERVRRKKLDCCAVWAGWAALAALLLFCCRVLILPLCLAAVLCCILLPAVRLLEGWRLPSWLAILLAYLVFFGGLAALGYWGVPRLWRDLSAISELLPDMLRSLDSAWQGWCAGLARFAWMSGAADSAQTPQLSGGWLDKIWGCIIDSLYFWVERSVRLLPSFCSNLCAGLSMLIFAPLFAFYLMRDRALFLKAARDLLPSGGELGLRALLSELCRLLNSFVRGYFLVAMCVGALFYLLLWLFRVKYSFTMGLLMFLAELIPYLGPFLAFFPCALLAALQGRAAVAKMVLIWFAVQQAENLFISPHIMGEAVRLHPLYVILAVLVGGFWCGVPGMILAVPLAAMLKTVGAWGIAWWRDNRGMDGSDWVK